ncbi:MAG: Asp-tRNA(Asn)/Glu-tRNA(Gln) amidotransferase subunit GatC [Phycisphaerae bacterium]
MTHTLDLDEVRHVARLARLEIDDGRAARYAAQLSKILAYVEQLSALDTDGVPPTTHPAAGSAKLREDTVHASLPTEAALHNAPQTQESFFKVPKVLDQEDA